MTFTEGNHALAPNMPDNYAPRDVSKIDGEITMAKTAMGDSDDNDKG